MAGIHAHRAVYRLLGRATRRMDKLLASDARITRSHRRREVARYNRFLPATLEMRATTVASAPDKAKAKGKSKGKGEGKGEDRSQTESLSATLSRAYRGPAPPGARVDIQDDWAAADEGFVTHLDDTFAALRRLLSRRNIYEGLLKDPEWAPKPQQVKLDIGQVFMHKKHGFRGVVVEWYEECPADDNWITEYGPFENGTKQPFYRTFVDVKDRPKPFIALAAEENLLPLGEEAGPVAHPMLDEIFCDFEAGRHLMHDSLQKKFPDDC